MLNCNKSNIENAKLLRKNMTPWERKLWYEFLRQYPVCFQRQKAVDSYIVDFYCAKSRLIIELDGSGHYENGAQKNDTERTEILSRYHLTVLRVCNTDIDRNFYEVCTAIDEAVRKSLSQQIG
jgi:very-short-patch-repair endonuclease